MTTESMEAMRLWSRDDYPILKTWWEGHGWNAVPLEMLPPLGVIWRDCAAGWVYMDNGGTGVAWLSWLVTNPKAKRDGANGISHVVEFLLGRLREMHYCRVLTTCGHRGMTRMLERLGFGRGDENVTHLLKTL